MCGRLILSIVSVYMVALSVEANPIKISNLSFDQDGIATGTVSADGFANAELNWDSNNTPTTTPEITKTMQMYIDFDGSDESTLDRIAFSLIFSGEISPTRPAGIVFLPQGSTSPGWSINGSSTIGGNSSGSVIRAITIAITDVTYGTGEIDEVNFTEKDYFADNYMVVNGVQQSSVLPVGNYIYTDPSDSDSLKFNTTGQASYMLGAMDLSLNISTIPEPATLSLVVLTGLGLFAYGRRK